MRNLAIVFLIALVSACAAKPTNPGAEKIYVSELAPPEDCLFVGEVQGSQGNFWTADFTSDRRLLTGARNEMRNQAQLMGANYVMIETQSHSHNTAGFALGGSYSSVIIGNAFTCHEKLPEHT